MGVNPFASHPNFFSVDSSFPYPLSVEQQQQRPFQLVFHPTQPLQLPGSTNTRDPPTSDPHNRHQPQRPFELDHPWQPSQPLVTDVRSYPPQFPSLSTSGQVVKQQEPSITPTHGRFATTTGIPDRSTDFMDTLDSKHQYPSHPVNPRLMAFPTTNDVSRHINLALIFNRTSNRISSLRGLIKPLGSIGLRTVSPRMSPSQAALGTFYLEP